MNGGWKLNVIESVWDASTLLALILGEPAIRLDDLLHSAVMSTVNLAEVRTKLVDLRRLDLRSIEEDLRAVIRIAEFTSEQAILAGDLRSATRHKGLSLGDRACLALAISLGLDVYTAESKWAEIDVACRIHLIR